MALCYKDQWFCSRECAVTDCNRNATDKLQQDAADFGLPIAFMDGSVSCGKYKPTTQSPANE